ncbi:nose resistant to fluoxetine protein 6-like [Ptychodera flava]|uniref:nose resistant to fluoxetine protein 6-like n=1 Tax=Ptychodera flava TaxID=63121 RepID=UPI003969EE3B
MASALQLVALLSLNFVLFLSGRVQGLPPQAVEEMKSQYPNGPYYAVNSNSTSQKCERSLLRLLFNETTKIFPAIDAAGKPGSGILGGNVAWLGSFELCRDIPGMQYCLVDMQVQANLGGTNSTLPIRWGLCAVEDCSETELASMMQEILQGVLGIDWITVYESSVHCAKDPPKPYNAGFYILISICIILVVLMLTGWCLDVAATYTALNKPDQDIPYHKGTTYSYGDAKEDTPLLHAKPDVATVKPTKVHNSKNNGIVVDLVLCFALNKNLNALLSTRQSEKAITCLHGLRVISITWVILGHAFLWPVITMIVDNVLALLDWTTMFTFQAIMNGTYSVDTFFFLSGLLVGYLVFFELDKRDGKFPWFQFYFHRYWRLTPTLLFTILFWMYIKPWLGQGPVWYAMTDQSSCEKYWWTNLLYINNFYPTESVSGCISWTWYLANDMQFHWISPIIIIATYKSVKAGITVLTTMLLACIVTTAALMGYYDFPISTSNSQANVDSFETSANYMDVVYMKPYCRIAPYLTGIALGFILQRRKGFQIRNRLLFSALGWILAVSTALAVVYGLYRSDNNYKFSTAENVIYASLSRFAWSLAVAWVVFACRYKMAGPVDTILSWDFWIPLSRLTYTAYLFHPMVLDVLVFNFATPFHYTFNIIAYLFVGVTFISYGVSALVYLAVEMPMTNIEKLIEDRIRQNRKEK